MGKKKRKYMNEEWKYSLCLTEEARLKCAEAEITTERYQD